MKEILVDAPQTVIWRNPVSIFKYNGWPSVCRDEKGTMYVTASCFRIQHVDPSGKNAMFVSFDDGHKWSKPIVLNDSRLDDRDTGIVSLGGGHMIAAWFSERTDDSYPKNPGFSAVGIEDRETILGLMNVYRYMKPEHLRQGSYVIVSDDYGFSWSDPIRVPMTAPHGPNRLSDGRAVYLGKDFEPCEDGTQKVRCYISSDYGRTWEVRGTLPLPENHEWYYFHEPHVVQLPGGRLFGALRVGRPMIPNETCYTTYSDDGGWTWSEPKFFGIRGLPPHLLLHSSGALILSYCDRGGSPKTERACVSHDGGETWTEDYVIDAKNTFCDLGYPATAECADGSLFTVYYQALPGENFPVIMGTRWNLEK